ncbi:MAG: type I restriction enzyme HsdR N-terminal domain-containing protein [Candidatus Cyclonatronum sp.]|uniref:type I restriction enzyme HsdR N-terminal domain-containing protein n=1 Tax=Cyclonatronum sp. TaxID=3024185 RepID=UPI0025BD1C56|nr:type I restriction enzyme HsdR N-terminal domain-containing protein [Cyclonatronum sp.]MCH8488102.1 type I restriction enzyme HsdR N-terminal domain-containing protein [Cyclonatronum sp.]
MSLSDHIKNVQIGLRQGSYTSEASVSQGIILPVLNQLGWPVFDTSVVVPEFSVANRRVDFALCHPRNKPAVFIEVKNVGLSVGADRQLFEYAFHLGVPMAILSDGQEWSFYLPGEQGRYDERRVYKIDLLERSLDEIESRLNRYLNYQKVVTGDALKSARSDYQNVSKFRVIATNLPKAWESILLEQDSLLLELLAGKVEDLCGYKPDLDLCSQFLEKLVGAGQVMKPGTKSPEKETIKVSADEDKYTTTRRTQNSERINFRFKDKDIVVKSAREAMTKLFELLASEDANFPERFASRKHGRKRRYLAKNKSELYPGRADLAEENSVEVVPGWWLGTNYSRRNIQEIIDLALEVADHQLSKKICVKVYEGQ